MSSSSAAFSLDHLSPPPSEQLCYVHCNFCDTVLAVSVPCSSLFKTVTVRCGHCTNLLSVNMRGLLLPAANQLGLGHPFLAHSHHNILDEITCPPPSLLMDQPILNNNNSNGNHNHNHNHNHNAMVPIKGTEEELPQTPVVNRREKILLAFFFFLFSLFDSLVISSLYSSTLLLSNIRFSLEKKKKLTVVQLKQHKQLHQCLFNEILST